MVQTENTKRTVVNQNCEWGKLTDHDEYQKLKHPTVNLKIDNSLFKFRALLAQLANYKCDVVRVEIDKVAANEFYKSKIKKILGMKKSNMTHNYQFQKKGSTKLSAVLFNKRLTYSAVPTTY